VLRQPAFIFWLGVMSAVVCLYALAAVLLYPHPLRDRLSAFAVCLPLGSLGVFLVVDSLLVTHRVDPDGITFERIFRSNGRRLWRDVVAVRFNRLGRWLTLRTTDGPTIRISLTMTNTTSLAQHLVAAVPLIRFSAEAEAIVLLAARGQPPPMIGSTLPRDAPPNKPLKRRPHLVVTCKVLPLARGGVPRARSSPPDASSFC
jgi:hypothetical protein